MDNAIYQNQLKTLLRIRKIYWSGLPAKPAHPTTCSCFCSGTATACCGGCTECIMDLSLGAVLSPHLGGDTCIAPCKTRRGHDIVLRPSVDAVRPLDNGHVRCNDWYCCSAHFISPITLYEGRVYIVLFKKCF